MEILSANLSGKFRREELHGRKYVVAPMTLLVPGVLNGSMGPLYYPAEEVSRNPDDWNGMPIVVEHPTENGKPVSGRKPSVIRERGIGTVYEATYDGKHVAEGWFDEELTKNYDRQHGTAIWTKLEKGEPLELSTGLYTKNEPVAGKHGDRAYTHIARNYRPDHLAILPTGKGACSIADGCGVFNGDTANAFCPTGDGGGVDPSCSKGDASAARSEHQAASRDVKELKAGIKETKGLLQGHEEATEAGRKAIEEVHASALKDVRSEYEAKVAKINEEHQKRLAAIADKAKKRREKLGLNQFTKAVAQRFLALFSANDDTTNPQPAVNAISKPAPPPKPPTPRPPPSPPPAPANNNQPTPNEGDPTVDKKQMVAALTANCDCWKGEEETLNKLSDDKLKKLVENFKRAGTLEKVAEAASAGFRDGNNTFVFNADKGTFVKNAFTPKDDTKCAEDDEECKAKEKEKEKVAANQQQKPATLQEWEASMPAEARATWNAAKKVERSERQRLVKKLVANIEEPERRQEVGNKLLKKSVDELEELVSLLPPKQANNSRIDPDDEDDDDEMDFSGAASGPVGNANDYPVELEPVSDWSWVENTRKQKQSA